MTQIYNIIFLLATSQWLNFVKHNILISFSSRQAIRFANKKNDYY
jgi:hypothetical protein